MFSSFQDTLLTSGFISKSWPLQETERQKSSDILEELRMQGIIRSQSTTASTEEAYEKQGEHHYTIWDLCYSVLTLL